MWLATSAFGSAGFGNATIAYVHASPSKASSDTFPVTPGPCPPGEGDGAGGGSTGAGGGTGAGGSAGAGGTGGGYDGCGSGSCCVADGAACSTNFDCCKGYCTDGACGRPAGAETGSSCKQNADCCADTDVCSSGTCATFTPR